MLSSEREAFDGLAASFEAVIFLEFMARILLIDDEVEIRSLIANLLNQVGHFVTEASDGRQGIELFRTDPFDLVITDLAPAQIPPDRQE